MEFSRFLKGFSKDELLKFNLDFGQENLDILLEIYKEQYRASEKNLWFEICIVKKNYGVLAVITVARNILTAWIPFLADESFLCFTHNTKQEELFCLLKKKLK